MKDDDKFYDSRRTKAVNKLILLWREGRPREIQRFLMRQLNHQNVRYLVKASLNAREREERERDCLILLLRTFHISNIPFLSRMQEKPVSSL